MGYWRKDVERAAEKIRRACPHLHVDNWCDYGFALYVADTTRGIGWTLFQPARFEGEVEISSTPEQIDAFIASHPPPSPKV